MRCRKNFAIEYYVLKSMKEGRAPMQHKGSLGVGTTPDHCLDINRPLLASMKPVFHADKLVSPISTAGV